MTMHGAAEGVHAFLTVKTECGPRGAAGIALKIF